MATIVAAPSAYFANTRLTYPSRRCMGDVPAGEEQRSPRLGGPPGHLGKKKGLGLMGGLNVLDGGDGSSGVRGTVPRGWTLTASELRTYGSALLAQSYICGFTMWRYSSTYYNRADINRAGAGCIDDTSTSL